MLFLNSHYQRIKAKALQNLKKNIREKFLYMGKDSLKLKFAYFEID